MSQRPHRCRTWSRRGQTPVLQYSFNWKTLSAVAGIAFWNFYFRLYPGTVKSAQVVDFLESLLRQIPGPLLIVRDRLAAHRSRLVRDFIASQRERLWVEHLPPYAPELNPVEYIWGHWKQHELPDVCPKDYWQLGQTARQSLKRMRRRPRLIAGFWQQAKLCFDRRYIMRRSIEDETQGLSYIKEYGGIAIAPDPAAASSPLRHHSRHGPARLVPAVPG